MTWRPTGSTLFPYTTLFRSDSSDAVVFGRNRGAAQAAAVDCHGGELFQHVHVFLYARGQEDVDMLEQRSEEHTSELQSRENLVCRLLLEKKQVSMVDSTCRR